MTSIPSYLNQKGGWHNTASKAGYRRLDAAEETMSQVNSVKWGGSINRSGPAKDR